MITEMDFGLYDYRYKERFAGNAAGFGSHTICELVLERRPKAGVVWSVDAVIYSWPCIHGPIMREEVYPIRYRDGVVESDGS